MHIENTYLATFSPATRPRIEKDFSDSVKRFFKHYDGNPIEKVSLFILKANPGGDSRNLIKVVKRTGDFKGINNPGVPASIWTEGTQGVVCLIQIEGMSDEEVSLLISNGPYLRKKKVVIEKDLTPKDTQETKPEEGIASVSQVVNTETIAPIAKIVETVKSTVSVPKRAQPVVVEKKKILSPHEKLVDAGDSEEEIDRLKATMASIVYREYGNSDIPDTIVVSVKTISKAALEHMKLRSRPKGEGGYRGIMANFYAARIALFGIKDQKSTEHDARYTDWIIDARLVLDFVGGKDSLACLTRKRDAEVKERLKKEAFQKTPPPTAKEVEKAAESFIEDAILLDLMSKMLEGKAVAEEDLGNAVTNRNLLSLEVMKLEQALMLARKDLAEADLLVKSSEGEVAKFILDEKTRKRMEEIKEKISALFRGLGM